MCGGELFGRDLGVVCEVRRAGNVLLFGFVVNEMFCLGNIVCENIYQSMNKIVESISKVEVEWQKSRAIFVLISLSLLYGGDYEIV